LLFRIDDPMGVHGRMLGAHGRMQNPETGRVGWAPPADTDGPPSPL